MQATFLSTPSGRAFGVPLMLWVWVTLMLGGCAKAPYWKIRKPDAQFQAELCEDCFKAMSEEQELDFYTNSAGEVFLHTNAFGYLNRTFDKWRDGVALEVVYYEDYRCGVSDFDERLSRRNGSSVANGTIAKPVYRYKLLRPWRIKRSQAIYRKKQEIKALRRDESRTLPPKQKRSRLAELKKELKQLRKSSGADEMGYVYLGELPKGRTGPYALNLIYLQKRKWCRVRHTSNLCPDDFGKQIPLQLSRKFPSSPLPPGDFEESHLFRVPFEVASSEIRYGRLDSTIKFLEEKGEEVKRVNIYAYASVEGGNKINDCLQCERGKNIQRGLAPHLPSQSRVPVQVRTETRWDLFYEQLEKIYAPRKPKRDDAGWEDTLARNPSFRKKMEPWLAEQRVALVEVVTTKRRSDFDKVQANLKSFQEALDAAYIGPGQIDYGEVKRAEGIQRLIYDYLRQNYSRAWVAEKGKIPVDAPFGMMALNQWYMRHFWLQPDRGAPDDEKPTISELDKTLFYQRLDSLSRLEPLNLIWRYNQVAFIINEMGEGKRPDPMIGQDSLFALIDFLRQPTTEALVPMANLKRLEIAYHLQTVRYFSAQGRSYTQREKRILRGSAERVYEYFKDSTLSEARAFDLAQLMVAGERADLSLTLLDPLMAGYWKGEKEVNEEVVSFYFQLTYLHPDDIYTGSNCTNLMDARQLLSTKDWCQLFAHECGIGFQALDCPDVREYFCQTCQGSLNLWENPASD